MFGWFKNKREYRFVCFHCGKAALYYGYKKDLVFLNSVYALKCQQCQTSQPAALSGNPGGNFCNEKPTFADGLKTALNRRWS